MNYYKLYEWLLENDCPFEWKTEDFEFLTPTSCSVVFTDKEEE